MALFIIGIIVFVFASIGLAVSLALWTYTDAKVKSDQSPMLWMLLVLLASPLGIILYLLLGRVNKDAPAPGGFKKLLIFFAIMFILATGLFTAGTIRFVHGEYNGGSSITSGSFTFSQNFLRNNVWTFSARTANGTARRTPNLTAGQLAAFHVLSDSGEGLVLRIEQGDRREIIDISGYFDNQIDMSKFEPGRVRIILEFDRARDVDVRISWRG